MPSGYGSTFWNITINFSGLWICITTILTSRFIPVNSQSVLASVTGQYIPGGLLQPGLWTQEGCVDGCKSHGGCYAVDYDVTEGLCWYHGVDTLCDVHTPHPSRLHTQLARCVKSAHISGGVRQVGVADFYGCVTRCRRRTTCTAVDYNPAMRTCWFHTTQAVHCPYTMHRRAGITHVQMTKCIDVEVRHTELQEVPVIQNDYTVFESHTNRHAYNGVLRSGVTTWQQCVRECVVVGCTAVDFDLSNGATCWLHDEHSGCSELSYKQGCTHYIVKACVVSAGAPPPSLTRRVDAPLIAAENTVSGYISASPSDLVYSSPPARCGRPLISPISSRIIGGSEAVPHSWPWMVALKYHTAHKPRCAGTLIHPQWVLTTAHCMDQDPTPSRWLVYVGSHDLKASGSESSFDMIPVQDVHIHQQFDINTFDNDIALIRLATPVTPSLATSLVCLPREGDTVAHGERCIITGWGNPSGPRRPMKQARIPIVGLDVCRRPDWLGEEFVLTDNMICAGEEQGGVDTCQGDSGGPLVCYHNNHWTQVGVTSFGRGCALPKRPGVYTNLARYIPWIRQYVDVT